MKLLQACGEPFLDPRLTIKGGLLLVLVPIALEAGHTPLFCSIHLGLPPLGPDGLLLVGQVQFGFEIREVRGFSRVALGAKLLVPSAWIFPSYSIGLWAKASDDPSKGMAKNVAIPCFIMTCLRVF